MDVDGVGSRAVRCVAFLEDTAGDVDTPPVPSHGRALRSLAHSGKKRSTDWMFPPIPSWGEPTPTALQTWVSRGTTAALHPPHRPSPALQTSVRPRPDGDSDMTPNSKTQSKMRTIRSLAIGRWGHAPDDPQSGPPDSTADPGTRGGRSYPDRAPAVSPLKVARMVHSR